MKALETRRGDLAPVRYLMDYDSQTPPLLDIYMNNLILMVEEPSDGVKLFGSFNSRIGGTCKAGWFSAVLPTHRIRAQKARCLVKLLIRADNQFRLFVRTWIIPDGIHMCSFSARILFLFRKARDTFEFFIVQFYELIFGPRTSSQIRG